VIAFLSNSEPTRYDSPFGVRVVGPTTTTAATSTVIWLPSTGSSPFEYVYDDSFPETETERLLREFAVQMRRWLATYQLWARLSRSMRRAQFLAQRLCIPFTVRDRRPHGRACSMANRWRVTP
jgi:hypothetical protein